MAKTEAATVRPNDMFWKILAASAKRPEQELRDHFFDFRVVGIDPGETTGVCSWNGETFFVSQIETKELGPGAAALRNWLSTKHHNHIRIEEFRIYNWMADTLAWSHLHTSQLIGALRYICHEEDWDHSMKLAQMPKALWSDDNLKLAGIYVPGIKHGRDALRHAAYYMAIPNDAD